MTSSDISGCLRSWTSIPAMLPSVPDAIMKPLDRPTWARLCVARRIIYGERVASTTHGIRKTQRLPRTGSSFCQVVKRRGGLGVAAGGVPMPTIVAAEMPTMAAADQAVQKRQF